MEQVQSPVLLGQTVDALLKSFAYWIVEVDDLGSECLRFSVIVAERFVYTALPMFREPAKAYM